jgi:restriction endonuclease Mrr
LTTKEKGDAFEYKIIEILKNERIKAYGIRVLYKLQDGVKYTGDGGIDIIGNTKDFQFIIQCKYKTKDNVTPTEIRDFIGALSNQQDKCIGIFVTNTKYSERAVNEAHNNKNHKIYLTTDNDLIKTFSIISNDVMKENTLELERKINEQKIDINFHICKDGEFNFLDFYIRGEANINVNNFYYVNKKV